MSIQLDRLRGRFERTAERLAAYSERWAPVVAELRAMQLPWYVIRGQAEGSEAEETPEATDVLVFDEIGGSFGVSAERFARDLGEISSPRINLRINSPGGNVFDAIAIHSALLHHPARVITYVDGLAASAASVIAMAGDEIAMMPGSQMMIHDASMLIDGNQAEATKGALHLGRQSDNIAQMYQRRAGGAAEDWRELMLAETWMFGDEAVDMGLADRVEYAREEEPDPELAELIERAHDLTRFRYRYASRHQAPAPCRPSRRLERVAAEWRTFDAEQANQEREQASTVMQARSRGAVATVTERPADRAGAAEARRRAYAGGQVRRDAAPGIERARLLPFASKLRGKLTERDGRQFYRVEGYASVFGLPYPMWDQFGEYDEAILRGAADATLASQPDVAFLVNHRGMTMARTKNGTLELSADDIGLRDVAWLNQERTDTRDLISAIDDELIDEQSFAFLITDASWNDDFTRFEIRAFDIDRGDVSAVNYGANPYTSIAARSGELMRDLEHLPEGALAVAIDRLSARMRRPVTAAPQPAAAAGSESGGSGSIDYYEALLGMTG